MDGANNKEKLNIILGKVHDDTTVMMVEYTLKIAELNFLSVQKLEKEKAEEILGITAKDL